MAFPIVPRGNLGRDRKNDLIRSAPREFLPSFISFFLSLLFFFSCLLGLKFFFFFFFFLLLPGSHPDAHFCELISARWSIREDFFFDRGNGSCEFICTMEFFSKFFGNSFRDLSFKNSQTLLYFDSSNKFPENFQLDY